MMPETEAPAETDAPEQARTFTDRASFLAVRDDVVARVIERMGADPDFERRILAEVYAASIETRLSLGELDRFLHEARGLVGSGLGKMIAGKMRPRKGDDDDGQV